MDAQQAFTQFAQRCLTPDKARRFMELCATKKGQQKSLDALNHEFESALRAEVIRAGSNHEKVWERPCFVFHAPLGFGVAFESVRKAYGDLSTADGWLILLADASAAIHRPESRWDDEKLIIAPGERTL